MLPHIPLDEGGCETHEAAIADLLDRALPPEQEAALRRHAAGCDRCAALLDDAERGQAWARILHGEPPVPPPSLLAKVLARTPAAMPGLGGAAAVPHPVVFQADYRARALMTAAMAVFSLALTFSVSGLRLVDLAPTRVEAAASRQFYDTKKQVVSFYDNLRLLRELKSSVEALRKPAPSGFALHSSALWGSAAPLASIQNPSVERNLL